MQFKNLGSVMASIVSPLYMLEILVLTTTQLKLWYYVGAVNDNVSHLTSNDSKQGVVFRFYFLFCEKWFTKD